MRKKVDARALLYERIQKSPAKFVQVTGVPYAAEASPTETEEPDQVWITLEAPPYGRIRAVINTVSRLNCAAGVSPHVRVGVQREPWSEKPDTGLIEVEGMNYSAVEAVTPLTFEELAPAQLKEMLLEKAKTAVRVEVWGDLYARDHLGIRQIHSRRASSAVQDDLPGRDGALRLYYPDNVSETFLFKFHGQP